MVDEQVEDAVVEDVPHAVDVEIGVVAKADAHRHQREGDREAEHDHEDEQAQHQDPDLRVGHQACSGLSAVRHRRPQSRA